MGARSKRLWLDVYGTNTGRSFGGESIIMDVCVGTSASYSRNIAKIAIKSWQVDNEVGYEITIDGQQYLRTSFDTKTKDFGEIKGNMVCGDPSYLEARDNRDSSSMLKMVSAIASMGEIFCDNKKEKNDWKARMLKAGIPEGALHMPDDWDQLDEDTKEDRLNKAIEVLGK